MSEEKDERTLADVIGIKSDTKTQERKLNNEVDPYLDYLYNRTVRCPYCRAKILKFTTKCTRCGINKKQLFQASNLRAKQIMKEKTGEKIFMTRRRPFDVSFTGMILLLLLGFFGAHSFRVGRKIRGWFMLVGGLVGLSTVTFPEEWTTYFEDLGLMYFPTFWFFLIVFFMWAFDYIAVVFGLFKYPVRLGEDDRAKK